MSGHPFLLELGTEELPVQDQTDLTQQLRQAAEALFQSERLAVSGIEVWAAPRRLVVFARRVALRQASREETILGPAKAQAFDAHGHPTPSGAGFLKKHGASREDAVTERTPRGEVLAIKRVHPGQPTLQVLRTAIPNLIKTLQAPKMMRWGAPIQFSRPIRSVVALLGRQIIPCRVGSLQAARRTTVYHRGTYRNAAIPSAERYASMLKRHGVIVDPTARRTMIERQLRAAAKRLGGSVEWGKGLLDEVTNLVEAPLVIAGDVDQAFLDLPRELILASMSKYQRIFALRRGQHLLPHFLAILNGRPANLTQVKRQYSAILAARLKDAQYFFQIDTRSPLVNKSSALSGIIFLSGFGTLQDKTERLIRLTEWLALAWQLDASAVKLARRACQLCKVDLTTQMVREFPSLQGIVGQAYALRDGEPPEAAQAIAEHYLPKSADDAIPGTLVGQLVALSDKMDHVVACFFAGLKPTGSEDPYSVKRQADGLIRLLAKNRRSLDLWAFVKKTLEALGQQFASVERSRHNVETDLVGFFLERLNAYLVNRDYRYDLVRAVLDQRATRGEGEGGLDVADLVMRTEQLSRIFNTRAFHQAARVVERTTNILKPVKGQVNEVTPSAFTEALERELWDRFQAAKPEVERCVKARRYDEATACYAKHLHESVHQFFDKVLVNVEDAVLRANRLALMKAINRLYTEQIADLAQLQIKLT